MAERSLRPLLFWAFLALLAAALSGWRLYAQASIVAADPVLAELNRVILFDSLLPRIAVAIVAGAALGLAGLLLQRVLRNPLAEPSTLGISAGAQLAMAAATIHAPLLMEHGREGVALAGGLAAITLVLGLTWRRGLEPVSVALAGMMVALTATTASAALILANGEYMMSLFIWGGGSLTQQSWTPTITIALHLMLAAAGSILLLRPLTILGLEDASARSLGMALHGMRLLVVGIAVWLATTVTAQVGVIGFLGLAAPALAALSGARTPRQKLVAAPVIGAILLWLTDSCVNLLTGAGAERIPTGAATALLGGPLLLWLLPRLRMGEWLSLTTRSATLRRAGRPWLLVAVGLAAVAAIALAALAVGQGPEGWTVATGGALSELSQWRAPRVAVAAAAGVMLAAAGAVIQRVTGNPLASPEVLGVGTGAGVGLAAVLLLAATAGTGWQLAGSAAGAVATLGVILAFSARGGFGPERLLFAGLAMGALCSAILTAIVSTGNMQAFTLLRWLSGSTNGTDPTQAWLAVALAAALVLPLPFAFRWLDILPLGTMSAASLGVSTKTVRTLLILNCGLLTAAAALLVGPLSFIGLIAPHLARLIGLGRALPHLAGSIVLGAGLMILSDWGSRMVAFPYEMPLGLFASLVGGPYLIWLLGRQGKHAS